MDIVYGYPLRNVLAWISVLDFNVDIHACMDNWRLTSKNHGYPCWYPWIFGNPWMDLLRILGPGWTGLVKQWAICTLVFKVYRLFPPFITPSCWVNLGGIRLRGQYSVLAKRRKVTIGALFFAQIRLAVVKRHAVMKLGQGQYRHIWRINKPLSAGRQHSIQLSLFDSLHQ